MRIKLNLFQNCALAVFALLCFSSCVPELDFESFEEAAKGSYARKLEVSGSYNTGSISTSAVDVTVEFYDQNQGQDVVAYDWTVSFKSNGGNNGEDVEAAFIKNLPSDLFSENADGLPEVSFSFELSEVLNALGIDGSTLTADDLFRFEATVINEDGTEFTASNTGPNMISQSPFNALFRLDVPVVCELDEDMFTGFYELQWGGKLGIWNDPPWGKGYILYLSVVSPTNRSFISAYSLPPPNSTGAYDGFSAEFVLDFDCDKVSLQDSNIGVGCAGSGVSVVLAQKGSTPGSFNILDDSSFTVNFTDDLYSSCGPAVTDISYTFVKL